jgi:outer membrane immunogenic protein
MRNSNLIIPAAIVISAILGIGPASAADLPARTSTKAPVMPEPGANWTGFYLFGGAGGGIWDANSNLVSTSGDPTITRDQRRGGDGWFGTVGAGYDWQFNRYWVAGIFADGQFGSLDGSLTSPEFDAEGRETLRISWAVGARLGYLVAPNVLSYANAGYTGSQWSSASLATLVPNGPSGTITTPSFNRSGFFVGGGVENSLSIFGISAPGWFMKTEYRAAYFDRVTLPETASGELGTGPTGFADTFKPFVQTISTSLVYRFNSGGSLTGPVPAADLPARSYIKAPAVPAPVANWTGVYLFGGVGGGVWNADGDTVTTSADPFSPPGTLETRGQRTGGDGWFGTGGAGYDWQFNRSWVVGIFADGQFGSLGGSITSPHFNADGRETLRNSWATGARLGYLVTPNVLSYVNAGYTGSQWSGASLTSVFGTPGTGTVMTPSFNRTGFFFGGGVENNLNIFGISAPGWFMKTEYRAAYFGRVTLPETAVDVFSLNGPTGFADTFKPFVQTISTSLVYRFNASGPLVAKY